MPVLNRVHGFHSSVVFNVVASLLVNLLWEVLSEMSQKFEPETQKFSL